MTAAEVIAIAEEQGFELAGVAPAGPVQEAAYYLDWAARGLAGEMRYLTDERADKRRDPRSLLASARSVLVHLSVLEKALGRHGLKALDELPPDVMRKAMSQLETLVSDWSNAHLAVLRAKLIAAVGKHERVNDRRSTAERLSDFQDSNRLQVNEASVTTFMEVNAQWERSLTGQKLDATSQ